MVKSRVYSCLILSIDLSVEQLVHWFLVWFWDILASFRPKTRHDLLLLCVYTNASIQYQQNLMIEWRTNFIFFYCFSSSKKLIWFWRSILMKWWIWQMISISLKCFDFFCDSFLLKITFISMCLWRPGNQEGWGPWGNFCMYWPSGVAYIAELMVAALCSVILVKTVIKLLKEWQWKRFDTGESPLGRLYP